MSKEVGQRRSTRTLRQLTTIWLTGSRTWRSSERRSRASTRRSPSCQITRRRTVDRGWALFGAEARRTGASELRPSDRHRARSRAGIQRPRVCALATEALRKSARELRFRAAILQPRVHPSPEPGFASLPIRNREFLQSRFFDIAFELGRRRPQRDCFHLSNRECRQSRKSQA